VTDQTFERGGHRRVEHEIIQFIEITTMIAGNGEQAIAFAQGIAAHLLALSGKAGDDQRIAAGGIERGIRQSLANGAGRAGNRRLRP